MLYTTAHGEAGTYIKKKPQINPNTVPIDTSMGPWIILLVKLPVFVRNNYKLKSKRKNVRHEKKKKIEKVFEYENGITCVLLFICIICARPEKLIIFVNSLCSVNAEKINLKFNSFFFIVNLSNNIYT